MEINQKVFIKNLHQNPYNGEVLPISINIEEFFEPSTTGVGVDKIHFIDDAGGKTILRVPENGIIWDKSNPMHVHNINAIKRLKQNHPDCFREVEIIDMVAEAELKSVQKELSMDLSRQIKEAKDNGNTDLIYNLARLVMPNSEKEVLSVVYNYLLDYASSNPVELNKALLDKDFDIRVKIKKAILLNHITIDNGIYKLSGEIIASSEDELVMYFKTSNERMELLSFKINTDALGISLNREKSVQVFEINTNSTNENTNTENVAVDLNKRSQIARWIKVGLIVRGEDGIYRFNNIPLGKDPKVDVIAFLLNNVSLFDSIQQIYKNKPE